MAGSARWQLVVIGASWGGMDALRYLLGLLPATFCASVLVAQHRSEESSPADFARLLGAHCNMAVLDADDGTRIEPGRVLVAPAGYHLLVEPDHVRLSTDGRRKYARPYIDMMFESAADAYGHHVMAVVLTGLNDDGADGVRAVKRAGGFVAVQDPAEAERDEMPRAAIATGAVDRVLTLERIAGLLAVACGANTAPPRLDGAPTSVGRAS